MNATSSRPEMPVRSLLYGCKTRRAPVEAAGSWRMFPRGLTGRFIYGFRRTTVHELLVVDTLNGKSTVLVDQTPKERRVSIMHQKIFDLFALASDELLAYWQTSKPRNVLMLSKISIDFKTRTFSLQSHEVFKCREEHTNLYYQHLITPIESQNGTIETVFLRVPEERNGFVYSLKLHKTLRQLHFVGRDISETFHVHHRRDADGTDWLYTGDDFSQFILYMEQLGLPHFSRVRCDEPLDRDDRGDLPLQELPSLQLQLESVRSNQKIGINTLLLRPVATHFHENTALVLFRARSFVSRAGQPPTSYRLFQVDLDANWWTEWQLPVGIFDTAPLELPQSFESLMLVDGVIELRFLFNNFIANLASHNPLPLNFFTRLQSACTVCYQFPFTSPMSLSKTALFASPASQTEKLPKTFRLRALF